MPALGTTYHDFIEHYSDQTAARGLESNSKMVRVPAEMMNPYAVGHMMNHPPPDVAANCKTVDLDIPYTFFPSYMTRYLPYINCKDLNWRRQQETETRGKNTLRAVGIVAQQTIGHGEELFLDYIEDKRTELNYTPDWLIKPPDANPYLKKKQMVTELPFAVKLLLMYDQSKKAKIYDEFEARVSTELPQS